ncbi:MAG TPA: DoxX-like family protein [Blastocatellia bacterium]|nr:DoxX-like family protein [Blastocatellia bacterium]
MEQLHPQVIFVLRVVVALVWLHEGLWLKLIARAPHEVAVVEAVGQVGPLSPLQLLTLIGAGETLLAVGVLSGLFSRTLSLFQIVLLVTMNTIGILSSGGTAIPDPLGLVIKNLPLLMCIALIGLYGPGAWAWKLRRNE